MRADATEQELTKLREHAAATAARTEAEARGTTVYYDLR